jgi:hypothetical protein
MAHDCADKGQHSIQLPVNPVVKRSDGSISAKLSFLVAAKKGTALVFCVRTFLRDARKSKKSCHPPATLTSFF